MTFAYFCISTTANKALEENLQGINNTTDKTVAELKDRIQGLEKELENANELLSSSNLRGQLSSFLPVFAFETQLLRHFRVNSYL